MTMTKVWWTVGLKPLFCVKFSAHLRSLVVKQILSCLFNSFIYKLKMFQKISILINKFCMKKYCFVCFYLHSHLNNHRKLSLQSTFITLKMDQRTIPNNKFTSFHFTILHYSVFILGG